MSSTATLVQAASAVPYSLLFSLTIYLTLFGGIALFFRPLLVGIGRALYLTVRPRPSKSALPSKSAWWRSIADLHSPSLKRGTGYGSCVFFRLSLCILTTRLSTLVFLMVTWCYRDFLGPKMWQSSHRITLLKILMRIEIDFRSIYAT